MCHICERREMQVGFGGKAPREELLGRTVIR
jgi:hypothetical protein